MQTQDTSMTPSGLAMRLAGSIAAVALFALPLSASLGGFDAASAEETATLVVQITGFEGEEGELAVALYADASGWLGSNPLAAERLTVDAGTMQVVFEGLAPGRYAALAYQDLNANGRLDLGAMRIPQEPLGYSAGAQGRFGPASFEAAAIRVEGGQAHTDTIRLRRMGGR